MKVFRNVNFTKRHVECTTIVACVSAADAPNDYYWEPCDDNVLLGLTQLWTERGITYYGYL